MRYELACIVALVLGGAGARGQSFSWMPDRRLVDASDDAGVMAGYDSHTGRATVWSGAGAFDLGSDVGGSVGVFAMSGNGRYAFGSSVNGGVRSLYRWAGPQRVDVLASSSVLSFSSAHASADGSVVVGQTSAAPGITRGFVWTAQGGMRYMTDGPSDDVAAVSRDAGTVCGYDAQGRAYVSSVGGASTRLEDLAGADSSRALGLSSDGSLVVGQSGSLACLWRNGHAEALAGLAGLALIATSVSDDGGLILGWGYGASSPQRQYAWTSDGRVRTLEEFLAENGITTPAGVELGPGYDGCTVSADGRMIFGPAYGDRWGGFVATIPSPSGLAALAMGGLVAARRRRAGPGRS